MTRGIDFLNLQQDIQIKWLKFTSDIEKSHPISYVAINAIYEMKIPIKYMNIECKMYNDRNNLVKIKYITPGVNKVAIQFVNSVFWIFNKLFNFKKDIFGNFGNLQFQKLFYWTVLIFDGI